MDWTDSPDLTRLFSLLFWRKGKFREKRKINKITFNRQTPPREPAYQTFTGLHRNMSEEVAAVSPNRPPSRS